MEHKAFDFELQEISEAGEFVGKAAVYDNVDLGNDLIEQGAFTKTLSERGSQRPLLWQHDHKNPVGVGLHEDSDKALLIKGNLFLEIPQAQIAHVYMKRAAEKGLKVGLSIGYKAMKQRSAGDVRRLKEIKLYETSIVTVPMNEEAEVLRVKSRRALDAKMDFVTALDTKQTWDGRYLLAHALVDALDCTFYDSEMTQDQKLLSIDESLAQFSNAYSELAPKFLALMQSKGADLGDLAPEISRAIAQKNLLALLGVPAAAETNGAVTTTSNEPDRHSMLKQIFSDIKGVLECPKAQ